MKHIRSLIAHWFGLDFPELEEWSPIPTDLAPMLAIIFTLWVGMAQADQTPWHATITTTASITTSSVKVLNENGSRLGMIIYNNSSNSVYISFDVTANSANHMTAIIPTFASWTAPYPCYMGPISAIRNAGSGTLMITEMIQ